MKQYYRLIKYYRVGDSDAWPTEVCTIAPTHINDAIDRATSIVDRERNNGLIKICIFRVSLTRHTEKLSVSVSPAYMPGFLYSIRNSRGRLLNGAL
jgi:hypothetical protein